MRDRYRPCRVAGCPREHHLSRATCPTCWELVPSRLQNRVRKTLRKYGHTSREHRDAVTEAIAAAAAARPATRGA